MTLINIVKGMVDGAEAIQSNFTAIGEMTKGTNANGSYVRFPNGFTIAWKEITYNNTSGWTSGSEVYFNLGTLPIAFTGGYITSIEASLYDGSSAFNSFKLNVSKIDARVGTIFVEKGNSAAKNIYLQAIIVGMS